MAAYKDFYIKHGQESNWVSFLDVDEFINPQKKENLCEWLSHMDKYPSILIYFKMFGTSGKMHHDYNKLVTEQYLVAWSGLFKVGKCLINTRYDIARYDATTHHCPQLIFPILWTKIKVRPANCFRLFVDWTHHFSALYNDDKATIQINHYWSKAWDVYDKKRKMTDVYFKKNPKENIGYFYKNEECNNSCDFSIFRRIMRLKFKMNIKD